jgi:hypothetical protein
MEASGTLQSLADGAARHVETDPQGLMRVENLPDGRHRLEVSETGFATQSLLIDVSSGPVGRTITMAYAGHVDGC